jgi:hypothetical protein
MSAALPGSLRTCSEVSSLFINGHILASGGKVISSEMVFDELSLHEDDLLEWPKTLSNLCGEID